jgi:hypothetical protein
MNRRTAQSGFALLVALVLVVLAGVALAALARRSAAEALEARTAREELQRRWAVTSLRAALLGRVEELLDQAERGEGPDTRPAETYLNRPMPHLGIPCRLAGADYELVLTDEQAKLNLNRLLAEAGRAETAAAARLATASAGAADQTAAGQLSIRPFVPSSLGPLVPASLRSSPLAAVGGYGQVFAGAAPERLVGREGAPGLAEAVTCWGDGRVNLRRAPEAVVRQACDKALGRDVVTLLLAARRRDPYRPLEAILAELDEVDEAQRAGVKDRLTDRSTCHGLWVIARGPQRSWYTFAVSADGERPREFQW